MVTRQDRDVNGTVLTTHVTPEGTSTSTVSIGVNSANAAGYSVHYEKPRPLSRREWRETSRRLNKKKRLW